MAFQKKDRKILKKIFHTTINARNQRKAIESVKKEVSKKRKGRYSDKQIKNFYQSLVKKHHEIKKYFNTLIGKSLQYEESRIAEKILIELTDKNIVCLPIHDSFVVAESNEQELTEAMTNAYKSVVGFNPLIKKKK
jgi:hypothetical protein